MMYSVKVKVMLLKKKTNVTCSLFRKCYKSSLFEVSRSVRNATWAGAKPLNCGAPPSAVGHTAGPVDLDQ